MAYYKAPYYKALIPDSCQGNDNIATSFYLL